MKKDFWKTLCNFGVILNPNLIDYFIFMESFNNNLTLMNKKETLKVQTVSQATDKKK
jgi:hypothetical protein